MKEFLFAYYKEIIVVAVFILEFVSSLILLIKKSKKEPSTTSIFLAALPDLINKAEIVFGSGNGDKKKQYVIDAITRIMAGYGLDEDKILMKKINSQIECILSTPTKKEVKDENKK